MELRGMTSAVTLRVVVGVDRVSVRCRGAE